MDKLYTVEGTANILNVHVNTVRTWLRKGTLNGVKIGKYWRITESQLKGLLEGQRNGGK